MQEPPAKLVSGLRGVRGGPPAQSREPLGDQVEGLAGRIAAGSAAGSSQPKSARWVAQCVSCRYGAAARSDASAGESVNEPSAARSGDCLTEVSRNSSCVLMRAANPASVHASLEVPPGLPA